MGKGLHFSEAAEIRLFIPISEKLTAGWENIRAAIERKDRDHIESVARESASGGALAINISGTCGPENELENLLWMMDVVTGVTDTAVSIDSADTKVLSGALKHYRSTRGGDPEFKRKFMSSPRNTGSGVPELIVNSITGEKKKYTEALPLVKEYGAGVVALAMDGSGAPRSAEERVRTGVRLVESLLSDGVAPERIFLDVLILPAGINSENGPITLEAARGIRAAFPDIHLTCGLSNVSHGLPGREYLNRTFLPMLIAAGVDSAIMDTTDPAMMNTLKAALALTNGDPFCAEYIAWRRNNGTNA